MDFWLRSEYAKWTATEEEIQQARRNRRKPPPFPLIPPVAARPLSVHERLAAAYEAISSEFSGDPRMVSDEELDALLGL